MLSLLHVPYDTPRVSRGTILSLEAVRVLLISPSYCFFKVYK